MTHPRTSRRATTLILAALLAVAALLAWVGRPVTEAVAPSASAPSRAMVLAGLVDGALRRDPAAPPGTVGSAARQPVLAVLPFTVPADDELLAGMGDALCDAVLEWLTGASAPAAAACNSARVAAQIGMVPAEVARLLGVGALLTGELQRDGVQVRVQARLVDARDGTEQWRLDASFAPTELHEMPRRLAARLHGVEAATVVARSGASPVSAAPPSTGEPAVTGSASASTPSGSSAPRSTVAASTGTAPAPASPAPSAAPPSTARGAGVRQPPAEAYALYLRAVHHQRRGGKEALQLARELLDRSLDLAPDYPPAVVASVALNSHLVSLGVGSGAAVDAQVRRAAAQLQRVDPEGPQAALVGAAAAVGAGQWVQALRLLDEGVARHPQHAPLLHTQAGVLLMMGYLRRAQQVALQVALREPLNASSHERLARAFSLLGDDARMHESATLAAELGWGSRVANFLAWHDLRQGRVDSAITRWREQLAAAGLPPDWIGPVLRAHVDPAQRAAALAAMVALPAPVLAALNHGLLAYALAGDTERAMQALDRLRGTVATMWVSDLWLPELAALRRHPGFVPWARATGLLALWDAHGAPDRCLREGGAWRCR